MPTEDKAQRSAPTATEASLMADVRRLIAELAEAQRMLQAAVYGKAAEAAAKAALAQKQDRLKAAAKENAPCTQRSH
jgi:hypothetical protein